MNRPSTTHLNKYAPARSRRITIGYKRAKGNKGERERQGTRLSHQHIPRSRAEVKVATMLRVVLACLPLICFMGYIVYTYVINNVCHQFHSVSQVQQSFIVGDTPPFLQTFVSVHLFCGSKVGHAAPGKVCSR